VFTGKLLENPEYIQPSPTLVTWCYGIENEGQFQSIQQMSERPVRFVQGIPNIDDLDAGEINLVIIDDLMTDGGSSAKIADLFTKGSHHRNISVVFIVQNLFHQGRKMRDISLNANYIVLFKNPQDSRQVRYLAHQISPYNPRYLSDAYEQATRRPHGYLIIDVTQHSSDQSRLLTNIFPPEFHYRFVPKSSR
jgi:hypothetical protein